MGKRAQQRKAAKAAARDAVQPFVARTGGTPAGPPAQRTAPPAPAVAHYLWDPESPWQTFLDQYPTPGDAIAAAQDDGALTCFSFEEIGMECERGFRRGPDGRWVYEVVLYPRMQLRQLVKTCWFAAEDPGLAVQQLRRALAAYVPESLRHPGIEVVERPSTTEVPRIGWAQSCLADPLETWEDVHLVEKGLPLYDLLPLLDGGPDEARCLGAVAERAVALFRGYGLAAHACAGCGMAITDRHPHWPGTWVSVEHEAGPCCERPLLERVDGEQRVGHVLRTADARPAQAPTGRERTRTCRNCSEQITDEHPDWPGTWTTAGGHIDPMCATMGNMGHADADEYDLPDCVYPHIPEDCDSPAATAIAAARAGRYFLQF
ncbi:hypothetical protein [Kitasatospora griseola]|uniref:hypothetical protein n=1 Tax=Kitasatospora griseola TaxID=2064 RepID=UPI003413EA21